MHSIQTSNVPYNNSSNAACNNSNKQCPWECLQFPGYCRSRDHAQFPGNFRETVWEPALGPGQPARHGYLFCYSDYSQTTQTWLHGLRGGLLPLAICTQHNSYVRYPGIFLESSRKRPGGPGGGAAGDEDGSTGMAREGAQDAGRLVAGGCVTWPCKSLTAASTASAPSGLEFETRDGSHSGAPPLKSGIC